MGVAEVMAQLKADSTNHGLEFFLLFFATHPHYQDVFPKLKGKSLESLRTDPAMIAQAAATMMALGKCVECKGDKGALAVPLGALAKSHATMGITSAHFRDAFDVFAKYLVKAGVSTDGFEGLIDAIMVVLTAELVKNGGK